MDLSVRIASREASLPERRFPALNHWVFAPLRWVIRLWRRATMRTIELDAAQPNALPDFDRLIEDAERGKPFAISIHGKPIVKVARMEKEDIDRLPKAEEYQRFDANAARVSPPQEEPPAKS